MAPNLVAVHLQLHPASRALKQGGALICVKAALDDKLWCLASSNPSEQVMTPTFEVKYLNPNIARCPFGSQETESCRIGKNGKRAV